MDEVRKLVEKLKFKVHDCVDDRSEPVAAELKESVKRLLDAVESKRDDDYVFAEAKQTEAVILNAKDSNILDEPDWDDLRDRVRDIKQKIHDLQ